MQLKHTPGPWIDGNTSDSIIAPDSSMSPDGDVDYYGGYVVAETVARYNKPLIKAAPDLLAACSAALPELEQSLEQRQTSGIGEYCKRLQSIVAELREAIEKAEEA